MTYVPLDTLLVDRIRQSLKPGGVVLIENFHAETGRVRLMGGGLADNELLKTFADFRILHYEDTWAKQDWGLDLGDKNRLVRLLAQNHATAATECRWQGKAYAKDGGAGGPLRRVDYVRIRPAPTIRRAPLRSAAEPARAPHGGRRPP